METLLYFFNSIQPLSAGLVQFFQQNLKKKTIAKGELTQVPGQSVSNIYFIESGLLKGYRLEGSKDICVWFQNEGNAVMSFNSWYRGGPTDEYIQALEDSEVLYISREDFQEIYRRFPEFNLHVRILTEQYYLLVWSWLDLVRTKRAKERYTFFIEHFGDWVKRVPSKDIASFLGLSPAHFSVSKRRRK